MVRAFTAEELAVLVKLADGGPPELTAQLASAEYDAPWGIGGMSFTIVVNRKAPCISLPDGIVGSSDRVVTQQGAIGGAMLWIEGGRLVSYEYYSHEGVPTRQPTSDEIANWQNAFDNPS